MRRSVGKSSAPASGSIFYGWIVIAVAFVTMGIGVNARTVFSLLFPPILDEFSWPRGLTAGAFSFGFLASGILGPILGRLIDRRGPRAVMLLGVVMVGAGLGLAPLVTRALASLSDARRPRRRRHRVPRLHRPRALPAELVRAPARPGHRHRVLRCRRGLDRHLAVDAALDRRLRVAHRVPRDGRARRRRAGAAESPDASPPGRPGAPAGRRSRARGRRASRPASGERRRPRVGLGRLDPGARDAHRALLVGLHRILRRALGVVRRAGAPDEVPDRDRLRARRSPPTRSASSASPASWARSRSAISRTASGASGCGRWRAAASSSPTRCS